MQSINNQIVATIKKKGRGKIFFINDFRHFGSNEAVRLALFRLCKEGAILRLSAGIYLYPKNHKYLGVIYPALETIAKAIAKQEKARIIPTGIYALNALGLSTQVPMRVVFLTDGTPRMINIDGESSIKLKKIAPKYLALKGKLVTLVIFALKEIGKNNVTEEQLKRIKEVLQKESRDNIIHDTKLAPEWISEIILNLTDNE